MPRTRRTSNGEFERGKRLQELVGVGHGPATDLDDQVTGLDPGRGGRTAVLDAADQDAVTLGEPDRSAHPARDVGWRDRDAEPHPLRRLAATKRIDPLAKLVVGRQREVEALADAVRVDADEPAGCVEERATGRARRERRRVLDAALDPPATGATEGTRDRGHKSERHSRSAAVARSGAEDRRPDSKCGTVAPLERRCIGGVDVDRRKIAFAVEAGDGAADASAVGERDGDLVTADVVGIGDDLARGR